MPRRVGCLVPVDRGNRWLYGRELDAKGSRPADATPARMLELIRLGSGLPALDPAIEQIGRFSFAAQVARRYRHGRTFLVGDAAHRMTPRGGTGLNTAVHDGHDLGWKLAWTIKGWSTPGFLNTYEAERRPIGVHNTARSAEPAGRARMAHDALAVDIGGRVPHMWLRRDGRQVSTLDVLGRGFTLVTGVDGSAWRSAASRRAFWFPSTCTASTTSPPACSASTVAARDSSDPTARPWRGGASSPATRCRSCVTRWTTSSAALRRRPRRSPMSPPWRVPKDPRELPAMVPFLSREWVEALDASLAASAFAPGLRLVIQHLVDDAAYHVEVEGERARVRAGRADAPTVTFTQDRATAAAIAEGRLSAQQAFMSGRLTVRGDLAALTGSQEVMEELDRAFRSVRQQTAF